MAESVKNNQKKEVKHFWEKDDDQKNFIERILSPGLTSGYFVFIRVIIFILLIFLLFMSYLTYSFHFMMMGCITVLLYFSLENYVKLLRKYNLVDNNQKNENLEEEEEEDKKEEKNKEKTD